MRQSFFKCMSVAILLAAASASTALAQDVKVDIGKRATAIPKICVEVSPASIEGRVDIVALVKEARCKGAGDMLTDYTYVMKYSRREKNGKGEIKEESRDYEVYMPTMKGGARAHGVLLMTVQNGVPVEPAELEKERLRAGERLEKEEQKVARQKVATVEKGSEKVTGMRPLGMYPRTQSTRSLFGFKSASLVVDIHTVLRNCDLTFLRREQSGGREMLVFSFTPRPDAEFDDAEQYLAQLTGTIWIDAQDRIVARYSGWPAFAPVASKAGTAALAPAPATGDKPPAVYVEMTRLPEGVWLPGIVRVDGMDYPKLFDGMKSEFKTTYSDYKRFNAEVQDTELGTPNKP